METTPQRSKLSIRKLKDEKQKEIEARDQDNEGSPLYFPSTQECSEEFDVLWDWNSPQTSQRKRMRQKRLIPVHSPILPVKKPNPLIQSQNFEALRNELIALKEELSKSDVDSYLCVSPQQEMEFKMDEDVVHQQRLEELFNDSVDEQAVLFSQRIEEEIRRKDEIQKITNESSDIMQTQADKGSWPLAEDSFDDILSNFDPYFEKTILNSVVSKSNHKVSFSRALSDESFNKSTIKIDFKKTRSFDANETILPQSTLDEIERKRLEALAKLEAKKFNTTGKMGFHQTNRADLSFASQECGLSQSKLDEIERKRLEALAKREAKKKQELQMLISDAEIEKKRREAMAKLEAKKKQESQILITHDEIERKRLEAMAKLEAKKRQEMNIRISDAEIERKRLEAIAKLEAKKKQQSQIEDETERKRREKFETKQKQETEIPTSDAEIERKRREAIEKREAIKLEEMIERNRQEALNKLRLKKVASLKYL